MKKIRIHIVPHAHWDKEWYFTKQDSDLLLNGNLEKLNKAIKSNENFKNFTYDGQSSIIDDFKIFNGNENELATNIKNNKIILGPWYSQPDLFNTTSEAIVRNLLIGTNMAESFGSSMRNAYVPDSFGQSSQMPQIYKLAELDNMIYWRGITKEKMQNSVLHYWEGLDGTKIKSYNFLKGYWIMGSFFPYLELNQNNAADYAKKFSKDFGKTLGELKKFNPHSPNNLLLPLGGDQAPVNEYIDIFLAELNKIDNEHDWYWSSYDEYFEAIENITEIPTVKGELKSPENSRIHKTIGSQRVDIKQLAKEVDNLIFEQLEPLAVYFEQIGGAYPKEIINKILKSALISHAHDSLGGCNTDATNKDVIARLNWAKQWAQSQITKIFKSITNNSKVNELILFNPNPKKIKTDMEMTIFTKTQDFEISCGTKKIEKIILENTFINPNLEINTGTNGESQEAINGYWKTKILLLESKFEGLQAKKLFIKELNNKVVNVDWKNKNTWENQKWKITITTDGEINLFDKIKNINFEKQMVLQAQRDMGDSYDFSPETIENFIINDLINSKSKIKEFDKHCEIIIENNYSIKNGKDQKILIKIFISQENLINFKVTINNKNENIKWRILFDSQIYDSQFSFANQAYGVEKRPVVLKENEFWNEKGWNEKPIEIETNESFVYLKNDVYQFGLITRGTNEYQIIGKQFNIIALTLFRSVSLLGRNNLLWRPGRASGTSDYLIETEDSKLLKEINFEFDLFVENISNSVWNLAQNKLAKPIYYQKQNLNLYSNRFERFLISDLGDIREIELANLLTIENQNLIVKAIKKHESKNQIILRIFNSSDKKEALQTKGAFKIKEEVNLLERKNCKPNLVFKSYEIKTFIIDRG
ncbi:alpha-mannosidase [Spiroplasma sabaudiense Ar-1343]|uniref:Alpha-mannosidase n=1 Tax=Spiroplasma sabaudiense Ar-1343 TaxID=1276257 RepID=W6AB34_9MOLU|nr:glycosyl hydrolase-related protein [Spiroplasma sabaudiense]AHI54247.1 alpha-mannosidase [Spiroplasma sabaudiense Ar-1343]